MTALCGRLPLQIEIRIYAVGNSLYYIFLHIRVLHFLVIILVGHKAHLQNSDRDCTPVDAGHVVIEPYAIILDSRCLTVGINDFLPQSAAFLVKLAHIGILCRGAGVGLGLTSGASFGGGGTTSGSTGLTGISGGDSTGAEAAVPSWPGVTEA